jgi:hypothetical protein
MTPGNYHLAALVNVEMLRSFYWKNGPAAGPNTPVDLAGYTARFVVTNAAGTAVINLTTGLGTIVLTPSTGKIDCTFSRAVMAAMAPGEYTHFLVLTSAAGHDYPLLTGRFTVGKGLP